MRAPVPPSCSRSCRMHWRRVWAWLVAYGCTFSCSTARGPTSSWRSWVRVAGTSAVRLRASSARLRCAAWIEISRRRRKIGKGVCGPGPEAYVSHLLAPVLGREVVVLGREVIVLGGEPPCGDKRTSWLMSRVPLWREAYGHVRKTLGTLRPCVPPRRRPGFQNTCLGIGTSKPEHRPTWPDNGGIRPTLATNSDRTSAKLGAYLLHSTRHYP